MTELSNKIIVIQDTWNDEDDLELLEYCKKLNTVILSKHEILELNINDIKVLFCETKIIQKLLVNYKIPDTYEKCFMDFYKRNIQLKSLKDCHNMEFQFFIKPSSNDKSFDATIINNKSDLECLNSFLSLNTILYTSNVIKLKNEYRLFIGNNKLYGIANASEYVMDFLDIENDGIKYFDISPPDDFIDNILVNNKIGFCIVDVGLTNDNNWVVVEVNPPFSISSYDYPIDKYFDYCCDAWTNIQNNQIKKCENEICKNEIKKCKNKKCNNKVKKCYSCFYDYKLKRIDNLFDFSKEYFISPQFMAKYKDENFQKRLETIWCYKDENFQKRLETIWCGDCNFNIQLYLKYGDNIPFIALQHEDVKITINHIS